MRLCQYFMDNKCRNEYDFDNLCSQHIFIKTKSAVLLQSVLGYGYYSLYANLYLEHLYTAVQNKLIQYISRVRLRIHAYSLCMRRCSNFKCQNAHMICHSLLVDKAIFAYSFVLNNFRLIVNWNKDVNQYLNNPNWSI